MAKVIDKIAEEPFPAGKTASEVAQLEVSADENEDLFDFVLDKTQDSRQLRAVGTNGWYAARSGVEWLYHVAQKSYESGAHGLFSLSDRLLHPEAIRRLSSPGDGL